MGCVYTGGGAGALLRAEGCRADKPRARDAERPQKGGRAATASGPRRQARQARVAGRSVCGGCAFWWTERDAVHGPRARVRNLEAYHGAARAPAAA
jgi:hypothetical protein